MFNRHNNALIRPTDISSFFDSPTSTRQRQYETLRAVIKEGISADEAGKKFGYSLQTVYSLIRDFRAGKLNLFPEVTMGPKRRRTADDVQELVINLRKEKNLSSPDIQKQLVCEGFNLSLKTIERILADAGFEKLKRRTNEERGVTKRNKLLSDRSSSLDFDKLEPFSVDCPVAGVFFFIPYILESGILDIVRLHRSEVLTHLCSLLLTHKKIACCRAPTANQILQLIVYINILVIDSLCFLI